MLDFLLFGLAPYLAAMLLVFVPAWRCLASPARRAALLAASPEEPSGAPSLWRFSLGLVLLGHVAAFLLPQPLILWNRMPARLLMLEASGFVLGFAAFAGIVQRFREGWSRGSAADLLLLTLATVSIGSGLAAAALYRWGSDWYALSLLPWFRSLVALRPDAGLVMALPPLVKLHVLSGLAATMVLPWSDTIFKLLRPVVRLGWLLAALARSAPGRAALATAELAMIAGIGIILITGLRRVGVSQGYAPEQPIAFSHKLHAGDIKIPCLYCHFARAHQPARRHPAGQRVHELPRAAREADRRDRAAQGGRPAGAARRAGPRSTTCPTSSTSTTASTCVAGVACQRCHGAGGDRWTACEQAAPLTMGWCLDCHRSRRRTCPTGTFARVAANVPRPAARRCAGLDCGKCHY